MRTRTILATAALLSLTTLAIPTTAPAQCANGQCGTAARGYSYRVAPTARYAAPRGYAYRYAPAPRYAAGPQYATAPATRPSPYQQSYVPFVQRQYYLTPGQPTTIAVPVPSQPARAVQPARPRTSSRPTFVPDTPVSAILPASGMPDQAPGRCPFAGCGCGCPRRGCRCSSPDGVDDATRPGPGSAHGMKIAMLSQTR